MPKKKDEMQIVPRRLTAKEAKELLRRADTSTRQRINSYGRGRRPQQPGLSDKARKWSFKGVG